MTFRRILAVRIAVFTFLLWAALAHSLAEASFIQVKDGYFWDQATSNYWVPKGFAYQTINPPVFATQSPAQISYDFLEMKKMHADSLRVDFTWGYIEPTQGGFSWTATDHIIAEAEKNGLRLFILIGYQYPPSWFPSAWMAVNQSNRTSVVLNYEHPSARSAYTNFISKVTGRYKDSPAVAGWILGNEYAYFDLWESYDPHLFLGYDTAYSLPSFRAYLDDAYGGNISALNANWGTAYSAFGDVQMPTAYPGVQDPGNMNLQNRDLPAYHDLIQWRKKSIGDFVALGSVAAMNADTNHLRSYSMVGGIYSGFDANNTCEDAKTIVQRCEAAGAPLHFWSINNYAWALEGNELRTAQYGIKKYQDQSGLPVLVTETGHSSTENLFPGASARQADALPGQLWEALMAGAAGVHIFTWNDRPFPAWQIREAGFGIVHSNRLAKGEVFWNVRETFRRMHQLDVDSLLGGSLSPSPDIYFYWSKDADMVWPRANQENCMLWGGLKRLGYEPRFLDESGFDSGTYTNAGALLLSHAFMMDQSRFDALTNVLAAGIHIHANATLPGRYDAYHKENVGWAPKMSHLFGLNVAAATNRWHGGIAGTWEQPYSGVFLQFPSQLGALGPDYPWTNIATWIRMDGISAGSGTTIATKVYDDGGLRSVPALHIKDHAGQARTAINTFTLGDTVDMWWLSAKSVWLVWQMHYDWGRAIYRDWFGLDPKIDISGEGYFYVVPDYRICGDGSVLISLLNMSSNAASIALSAPQLIEGMVLEQIVPPRGTLTNAVGGPLAVTLQGDEYVLLRAYAGAPDCRVWLQNDPSVILPTDTGLELPIGFDTCGETLTLQVLLESDSGVLAVTNIAVSGLSSNVVRLLTPDADLCNPSFTSSADGGSFTIRASLERDGLPLAECSLPARMTWGIRPSSIPETIEADNAYNIEVTWQELPSYLGSELPTPLDRIAVWSPAEPKTEQYSVFLDLLSGESVIVSTGTTTTAGAGSHTFSISVPPDAAGPFNWRVRALTGSMLTSSNRHDVVDSFEDRARGDQTAYLAPWQPFAYAEWEQPTVFAEGVNEMAADGTNAAFMVVSNPNPGGWSGFGMIYDFPSSWALPPSEEWSNITFAFSFLETNGFAGVLEIKLEDSGGHPFGFTRSYGGGWETIQASVSQFTKPSWDQNFNPSSVKRIIVIFQMSQAQTHLGLFDNIRFVGTPWVVSQPPTHSDDLHSSFEDLERGEFNDPTPWSLQSYGDGTERYLSHGIGDVASDGANAHFAVFSSHTTTSGWSGFYINYDFSSPPDLPTDLSQVGFSVDFNELDGLPCTIELQVKDGTGTSSYSRDYSGSGWDTIHANLDQFSGNADMHRLSSLVIVATMNRTNSTYVGYFDNIQFTGSVSRVGATNALYLSINDNCSLPDSDGDGVPDIYETGTGVYVDPSNTGTDPLNPDSDGDGIQDGDEVIAGTDPNLTGSVFTLDTLCVQDSELQLEWFARTGRVYSVHYSDGSLVEGIFQPLENLTNIVVETDGFVSVSDTTTNNVTQRFYRISVARP